MGREAEGQRRIAAVTTAMAMATLMLTKTAPVLLSAMCNDADVNRDNVYVNVASVSHSVYRGVYLSGVVVGDVDDYDVHG
eukprot:9488408-Pyramimonas_sp.AAC.2